MTKRAPAALKAQVASALDEFANRRDIRGRRLYPHFDVVVSDIASLIESGRASSLPRAYREAVRFNRARGAL